MIRYYARLVKLLGQHLTTRWHCSRLVLQRFLTISQYQTCQLTCNSTFSHAWNVSLLQRIITFVVLFCSCRYVIASCVLVKFYIVGHHPDDDNSNKMSCGLSWCSKEVKFHRFGQMNMFSRCWTRERVKGDVYKITYEGMKETSQ